MKKISLINTLKKTFKTKKTNTRKKKTKELVKQKNTKLLGVTTVSGNITASNSY